ncbi:Gfo/Idh/MocA family protein [Dongia sp.]|uniref:Gfo/Idh/MocA family protein n=1 Tax=Dongia sp. TaxID=1977262 RepID=UPI0037533517
MSVRVGIIGVGVMGSDHARILATQVPGATIGAIYDADPARARSIADETGAAKVFADAVALIQDAAVDAVLVASPDQTHKDLTLAAIAAGKPVLCEKPLAPTPGECLEVLAAEAKSGRRLVQIGYMRRFDPSYAEMKAGLRSGRLGSALMFHCIHRNVAAPSWFDSKMAVSNSAVHEFDIARWMLDAELTGISVFRPKPAKGSSPGAPVYLVLESATGQLVTIEVFNDAAYGYDVRGELVCEKGTIALRAPLRTETNAELIQGTAYPVDWRPRFADAYRLQAQAWINSIGHGGSAGASAWDGYAASAVAEAGLLSLAEGRRVAIELADQPALYR